MSELARNKFHSTEPDSETIVIPASVTVLTQDFFANAQSVKVITFEPGSQIRRLERATFIRCTSLKSIYIPASVEFIGAECFIDRPHDPELSSRRCCPLRTVKFEAGSKLREIESDAFFGCLSLNRIRIPSSIEKMDATSLPHSVICRIEVERGNPYFSREGDFLLDLTDHRILRYYGAKSELTIPDETEKISEVAFSACRPICVVRFGRMSRLSSIDRSAFAFCPKLQAITIPSSVTFLGDSCFLCCPVLECVSFCPGSKLAYIPNKAFHGCTRLESITLLTSITSRDSRVVRIGHHVFDHCQALKAVFLPSSVEFVGESCFTACDSLSTLTFSSPSHLRELLDLPPDMSGFVSIPDSVEILSFHRSSRCSHQLTLVFGCGSRLVKISAIPTWRSLRYGSFLQVSTHSLKVFRRRLEFETDGM
jgi:hypothetical protein